MLTCDAHSTLPLMARTTLTSKQAAYANARIAGMGPSDAYRSAYNTDKMKKTTIARKAADLENNGNIAAIIAEKQAEAASNATFTRERYIEQLEELNRLSFAGMASELQERGRMSREYTALYNDVSDRLAKLLGFDEKDVGAGAPVIIDDITADE